MRAARFPRRADPQLTQKRTFEGMAEQAMGKVGRHLVQVCTIFLNLGSVVAFLNILADVLSSVAGERQQPVCA